MAKNVRIMHCPPDAVFDVFRDGWLYPVWVVGASRMRALDRSWPSVGARLHHSFGVWPIVTNDVTTILEWDPPRRVVMQAKGWPLGEARIEIAVEPHRLGSRVTICEDADRGPGTLIPGFVMQPALFIRNHETLRRLGWTAVGRHVLGQD